VSGEKLTTSVQCDVNMTFFTLVLYMDVFKTLSGDICPSQESIPSNTLI